jgi:serine/threonine protein kinase
MEGLKIGQNGINALPSLTQSQSSSSSSSLNISMSVEEEEQEYGMSFATKGQVQQQQQEQQQGQFLSSLLSNDSWSPTNRRRTRKHLMTFDSPPPALTSNRHHRNNNLKGKRYKPYQSQGKEGNTSLEEYEAVKILGRGASSMVSLVRDRSNKLYAKKLVHLHSMENESTAKLILNEIKALEKCKSCPYIVKHYNSFYKENAIHILLEYMDRNSLQELLKTTKHIPEHILKLICVQVLLGLQHLHNKKITHRDIKPANILINKKGRVKISDFGLTGIRSTRNAPSTSSSISEINTDYSYVFNTYQGTWIYMSPERIRGEKYSFNADVWALGISLIELSMGELPFKSNDYFEIVNEIVNVEHSVLSPLINNGLYSTEFMNFINQCLQVEPGNRPDASDLLTHPWIKELVDLQLDNKDAIYPPLAEWLNKIQPIEIDTDK